MNWADDQILVAADVEKLNPDEREELKYRIQTDLFFLANNILRNKKAKSLLKRVHGGICDTLVQKDPTKPLEEWSPVKERVILSSRGTLKSTLEAADIVQIILCEPNIRMLIVSGKLKLAQDILKLSRGYFESNEVLGMLFPQWCAGIKVNQNWFVSPARSGVNYRDPTIQISTFDAVKAGIHVDWIKIDDATNEINSATPELVEKTCGQYDDLNALLEPGGYTDLTATRWAVDDLPEKIRQNGEDREKETGVKHVLYFCQPIWKVKKIDDPSLSPALALKLQLERNEREKTHKLVPDDVELLWPEKLTPEFLWPMYRKNPRWFLGQYLLSPEDAVFGVFTRKLLERQTRPLTECPLPHRSIIVINWDLAGISGKGDYAAGIVGIWEDTGRLYIIDAVVRKFRSSTEICNAIVGLFKKYYPDYHRIEAANGTELLSGELRIIAQNAQLDRAFIPGWDPPVNEQDAKNTRIRLLAGAMEQDKLQFFSGIPDLQEIFSQFEKFTGKTQKKIADDAPDSIAQMYEKWKNSVGVKSLTYTVPSGEVLDFQSQLQVKNEEIDPHLEERQNADIAFLQTFTAPHAGA